MQPSTLSRKEISMRRLWYLPVLLLFAALNSGCGESKEKSFTSVGTTVGSTSSPREAKEFADRGGPGGGGAGEGIVKKAMAEHRATVEAESAPSGPVAGSELPKVARPPVSESDAADKGKTPPAGDKAPAAPAAPTPAVADPVVAMAKPTPATAKKNTSQSGLLTAGSFDDNVNPQVFRSFASKMAQNQGLADLPTRLQGERLTLLVRDSAGKPIADARVVLRAGSVASPELPTRTDGRAVFVLSWDKLPADQPLTATVTPPGGGSPVVEAIAPGSVRWEVTLSAAQARLPKSLDLAIVLDTTGSMGDELGYLKTEIRGISEAVQRKFPEVKQRFALVLYRDAGDEYVTRSFDFTESLDEFHKRLSAQSAGGGGDYPEAMHRGLEDAQQLRWREADTARVLFLIGDAPPHAQHMGKTMAAADALRKKGVAIYPIACSGYDDACEFVMRSCALLTGSQFLFLTDDSGVGNAHAEPRIPYYQVERLEKLMVRTIASELGGRRLEPEPSDVIRTVGRKVN
jgi:hypothetical protein